VRQWLEGRWRRLVVFAAVVGPGIITANVDNDAGGITTYSLAGAIYGYRLLWTVIPVALALFVVQEMSSRLGVVAGKGLADLVREQFGVKATFYLMVALLLVNWGNTMAEFAGLAAALEIVHEDLSGGVDLDGIIDLDLNRLCLVRYVIEVSSEASGLGLMAVGAKLGIDGLCRRRCHCSCFFLRSSLVNEHGQTKNHGCCATDAHKSFMQHFFSFQRWDRFFQLF